MRNPFFIVAAAFAATIAAQAVVSTLPAFASESQSTETQAAPQVRAGDYRLDKSHAKILWSVSHFGFSTYYGEFTDFDAQLRLDPANPQASQLTARITTASIATHNEALDTHLKSADFFDVANHDEARFVSTNVRPTGPTTAEVTGQFTMLGQTRPLTLDVTFNQAGDNMAGVYTAGFSASGKIRRSDYGMRYGLPAVGDEIELTISGEFNPA